MSMASYPCLNAVMADADQYSLSEDTLLGSDPRLSNDSLLRRRAHGEQAMRCRDDSAHPEQAQQSVNSICQGPIPRPFLSSNILVEDEEVAPPPPYILSAHSLLSRPSLPSFRQKLTSVADLPPMPSSMEKLAMEKKGSKPEYMHATASSASSSSLLAATVQPPIMLEIFVGHRLASKLTKKRKEERLAQLDEIHDAWLKLGLDTRKILATGQGQLPPHFWSPPGYGPEEMDRRLHRLAM